MHWHQKDVQKIMQELTSSPQGLSSGEALRRLGEYGSNLLQEKQKKTALMMLGEQFKDFMILVLIAAALIAGIIGDLTDAIAIVVIVILNAVIGFVQEYRAEAAMAALKKMAAVTAIVMRDGIPAAINGADVVPGDLVLLEAGGIVPADLRCIETVQMKVEEAALTGESLSVEKHTSPLSDGTLPLGDRKNMAYKGTFVTHGRGTGIVVATGMDTELGKIASMLQEAEEVKTPLQKRLANFGRKLSIAVLVICAFVFGAGMMRGAEPLLMLLTAISLAVAAIPEALPAVITISLALGAKKLVQQKALIRKLPSVETLGSVTYICSDKTGTLTVNKMSVEEVYYDGTLVRAADAGVFRDHHNLFMAALALSNDAKTGADGAVIGDPTETALYHCARTHGFDRNELEKKYPRVAEIPFDSQRKCMTTMHSWEEGFVSFTKGALESLLDKSVAVATSRGLTSVNADEILKINDRMAAGGLRVLGVAMRKWNARPDDMSPAQVETELTLLGLAGMMDPPRQEAKEAVSMCKEAGIKPVMITGDHPGTAVAIARRLDIIGDDLHTVMSGRELEQLPLDELEQQVEQIRIYARVAPEQKLKIVRALQDRGQFVAMTGDGVNDAPALRRADIGVAMGITGTDVSKEAAHMILLDDNFATIVNAVREGRKIFDNIRKFIKYLLTTNSGEIWTLFLASLSGLPMPLLPIHILWINLVTDGLPALALSVEPAEVEVMKRPPRHPRESIFAHGLGLHTLWVGLLMAGIVLAVQVRALAAENARWQTMVFTVLCLSQLGHVLAIRSEKESLFRIGLFSNPYLLFAVLLTFLLQMATVYLPPLNHIFKTEPLTVYELLLAVALSSIVFFAVECEKLIKRIISGTQEKVAPPASDASML